MSLSLLKSYPETDFTPIESYLIGKVQGVPQAMIGKAISEALDEFCRESLFWREEMILYPTVGFSEYPIPNVGQTRIIEVISARYEDGAKLVAGQDYTMRGLTYMMVSDDVIKANLPIIVEVALAPVFNASVMSKTIADQCADWISNGAAGRLLSMSPDYPWSNPAAGQVFVLQFERDKRSARRMALNNFMDHHNPPRKYKFY